MFRAIWCDERPRRRAFFLLPGATDATGRITRTVAGLSIEPPTLSALMEAQIRMATRGDAEALARLRWNMHTEEAVPPESYESFVSRFRAFAEGALNSAWKVWVAEVDSELVANLWLQVVPRVPRPVNKSPAPLAYLTNVYVEPPYRNAGLGSRMLREVIDWSREHPVGVVVVWPADQSVPYYRRAGFQPADSLQLALTED